MTAEIETNRICFVEMLGAPGSYDASLYENIEGKDNEGIWFAKRFGGIDGFTLETCNISRGAPLPEPTRYDGIILGGSHNSVLDQTEWQERLLNWLPSLFDASIPVLAICGSHQLLAQRQGATVADLADGPYAGSLPIAITQAGLGSALLKSIPKNACFQFGNSQHVEEVPKGATLLASSGRNPVAVLDFGNHCYSVQFHPECTDEQISTIWCNTHPERMQNYFAEDNGYKLVSNFFGIVAAQKTKII